VTNRNFAADLPCDRNRRGPEVCRHLAQESNSHPGVDVEAFNQDRYGLLERFGLDTYADLFDADLDTVAESVGKLWAKGAEA
jgi:hypothetical protein